MVGGVARGDELDRPAVELHVARGGDSMPARTFMSVDLPAPFSPNSAVTRPWTPRSNPLRACVPPYTLVTSRPAAVAGHEASPG